MADNLKEILDIAKRELPDIPPEVWARVEGNIRQSYGGQRPYIAARRKRYYLEELAIASETEDINRLASKLGVSVRTIQRLKKLNR